MPELFAEVARMAGQRGLLSADYFSVDGTLIQTWASHKSFRPKDDGPGGVGRNRERDFHGEARKNDTHASVTDPEARLYRKSANTAAVLCYQGHTVVEHRNGLVVRAEGQPCDRHGRTGHGIATVGVATRQATQDRGGRQGLRRALVRGRLPVLGHQPHVAGKDKDSALDQRTVRHVGYAISEIKHKRVEEPFGWMKLIAQLRQVKQCGNARVGALFQMGMMGLNLIRIRNLMAGSTT